MSLLVAQDQNTRRRVVALLGWLREGDPDATAADLCSMVLGAFLNRRGLDFPDIVGRSSGGARPTITSAEVLLSRPILPIPGGIRNAAALRLAAGWGDGGTVTATWSAAVAECYFSITAPVTAEDLGPVCDDSPTTAGRVRRPRTARGQFAAAA